MSNNKRVIRLEPNGPADTGMPGMMDTVLNVGQHGI